MTAPKLNVPNQIYTEAKENSPPPRRPTNPPAGGMKHATQNLNVPHPTAEPTMDERYVKFKGEVDSHWGRGWAKYFQNEIQRELVKAEAKQKPKLMPEIRMRAEQQALDRLIESNLINENLDYLRAILEVLKEGNR